MKSWVKVARYHLVRPVLFVTLPLAILAFVFAVDVARGGDTFRDGLGGIFLMFFITGVQRIGGWLPFGLALGATRRSFYAGTALLGVSMSLLYGLVIAGLQAIERATGGWGLSITFFRVPHLLNGPWYATWLTSFVGLSALFVYGMWYGIVNRRWGMLGLIAFVAAQVLVVLAYFSGRPRAARHQRERPRPDRRHRRPDGSVPGRRPRHDPPRHGLREPRPLACILPGPLFQPEQRASDADRGDGYGISKRHWAECTR